MTDSTPHPGVTLRRELEKIGITPTEFARQIDVPANRVSMILAGKRSITGDSALRFGHWFKTNPLYWLHLQSDYDLAMADQEHGAAIRSLPTKDSFVQRTAQDWLL